MSKRAFILYDAANFAYSKQRAEEYLRERGFTVFSQKIGGAKTVDNLPNLPDSGKADVMVWYSHGGWDGPMIVLDERTPIPFQVSPSEPEEWSKLKTYIGRQLRADGVFIAHSCHAAGSDWREKNEDKWLGLMESRNWIESVAKDMNVYTFGQAGKAAAGDPGTAECLLDFALTGESKGFPFFAYSPGGVRINDKSKWPKL